MPPKAKRQNQNGNDGDEPFQAVVLADSYDEGFIPMSHEMPRCLMPLCNIPLIEYTMEVLAMASEVDDVFVVCTFHIEQIKNYFENSKWTKPECRPNVQIVQAPNAMSVGDALREIDSRQLVSSDFILTTGFLVSNIRLDNALARHRERRKKDKESILTMVLKEASRVHSCRPKNHSSVFVLDPVTEQCMHYKPVVALPREKAIEIEAETINKRSIVEFRNDLIDPRLDICAPNVLALFTENFDWQHLRNDFIHGVLTSDIISNTIYTNVVSEPYLACIENEQLYSAVSQHVLSRWAFPIVPETNLMENDDYELSRGHIYKADGVKLSRSCVINEMVQIGSETIVGESSRISRSVIGKRCRIGNNVVLDGVFLWDDVQIEDNCEITNSILAYHVSIKKNTVIRQGCHLSIGVQLGPGVTLPKYTRLSLVPQPKGSLFGLESDDEDEPSEDQETPLSSKVGPVHFWSIRAGEDDDDIRNIHISSLAYDMADLEICSDDLCESASDIGSESEDDFENEQFGNSLEHDVNQGGEIALDDTAFKEEVRQTVERALEEDLSVDNAGLEISSLRLSHNQDFAVIREVSVPVLIEHIVSIPAKSRMSQGYERWGPLINKVTHDNSDQAHVLEIIQKRFANQESLHSQFMGVVKGLYHCEVIEEEGFFKWYNSESAKFGTPEEQRLRDKVQPFAQWLEEAEEETEDESD